MILSLILIIAQVMLAVILIRNGRKYAGMLLKDEPEGSWEDVSKWDLDRRGTLMVLFIGIGLYTLIQTVPALLQDLFRVFRDKASYKLGGTINTDVVVTVLLKTVIGAFLIYAAPTLTNFIERTIAVRLDIKENKQDE